MYIYEIGLNAGIIWDILSEKGALSLDQLGNLTGLDQCFLSYSLGWLAKEQKVSFYEKRGKTYVALTERINEVYY